MYIQHLTEVAREIWRVLRNDGTLWLNLGDCYAGSGSPGGDFRDGKKGDTYLRPYNRRGCGLKPKDLAGIPWRVAFALQADGWWLRSDVVWAKPNPMPESVRDRPTRAHEYVFLLTKSPNYFFDQETVREPVVEQGRSSGNVQRFVAKLGERSRTNRHIASCIPWRDDDRGRNIRSVWTIPTQPYSGAHFATFPEALARTCILVGTSEAGCCASCGAPRRRKVSVSYVDAGRGNNNMARKGVRLPEDTARPYEVRRLRTTRTLGWQATCQCSSSEIAPALVLDPFMGSGTVGVVAAALGRNFAGVDLKPEYVKIAAKRIRERRSDVDVLTYGGRTGQPYGVC